MFWGTKKQTFSSLCSRDFNALLHNLNSSSNLTILLEFEKKTHANVNEVEEWVFTYFCDDSALSSVLSISDSKIISLRVAWFKGLKIEEKLIQNHANVKKSKSINQLVFIYKTKNKKVNWKCIQSIFLIVTSFLFYLIKLTLQLLQLCLQFSLNRLP